MPVIKKNLISLENLSLIGYDKIGNSSSESIVHFFLDDYKFESLWNNPELRIEKLRNHRAILTPQFSLYTEMPLALKVYNTFKNRWCGAYYQSEGIHVIPSILWGTPETFWFCFDGIEPESYVAVSTIGMRKEKDLFLNGYREMVKRISPTAVICYGEPFDEMTGNIIPIDYAEANNLSGTKHYSNISCIIKGGGMAGGNVSLPKNNSQMKHIFRNAEGHLPDTPENQSLLLDVANNENNYIGTDSYGNRWYVQNDSNGNQIWTRVRDGIINNGGINNPPRGWDSSTGLNNPLKSGGDLDAYFI